MQRLLLAAFMASLSAGTVTLARADTVQGSGSTFVYPLLHAVAKDYREALADGADYAPGENGIDYEPVGSLGGILRLQQPEIDFAAIDFPLPQAELAKFGYVQFPIVIGGIVPVVNITYLHGKILNLPGSVLADIYLGKIQNWNDPDIAAVNSGIDLPDLRIAVVQRSDGSGSTFNWTQYLSASSGEWRAKYGADTLINWPLGTGVKGGSGLAAKVAATEGAIGYLEFGQATRAGLTIARVSAGGGFVLPETATMTAAADTAGWTAENDFSASLINSRSPGAYPITAATYIVMRNGNGFGNDNTRTLRFFQFLLEMSSETATELGYAPLPKGAIAEIQKYWAGKFGYGS